jgi:hypothetical protein
MRSLSRSQIDIASLDPKAASTLDLNAIGLIEVETDRPVLADLYNESRATGSFILIDPASNATVGAGMIRHVLTRTSTNSEQPSIVIANTKVAAQLEQHILDLGHAVVRTRVQDEKVWRALQHAGVTVLVESDGATVQVVDADFARREIGNESIDAIVDALRFAAKVEEKDL